MVLSIPLIPSTDMIFLIGPFARCSGIRGGVNSSIFFGGDVVAFVGNIFGRPVAWTGRNMQWQSLENLGDRVV